MTMQEEEDRKEFVLRMWMREKIMEAIAHPELALDRFDQMITDVFAVMDRGVFAWNDVTDELAELIPVEVFNTLMQTGVAAVKLPTLSVDGRLLMGGGMLLDDDGEGMDVQSVLLPLMEVDHGDTFPKAIMRLMHRYGLDLAPGGVDVLGPLADEVQKYVREAIDAEIDRTVEQARIDLEDMLSVEPIVSQRWSPPEGGANNDLPRPY